MRAAAEHASQRRPRLELPVGKILDIVEHRDKDYLLLQTLWQTGARVSEALNLKVKDIDFHAKTIKLITLKRRTAIERVIPVKGAFLGILGAYIAAHELKREDRLLKFTRQRAHQIIRDAVLNAGFDQERAHPHTFRHSFGVFCVLSGVPVIVIKNWMGHSNIQSTLIYMQVLGSDTRHFYESLNF